MSVNWSTISLPKFFSRPWKRKIFSRALFQLEKMAASVCDSPLLSHCSSVSPFYTKNLLAHHKTHVGSSFLGRKFQQSLNLETRTSNSGSNRRRQVLAMASLGGLLGGIFKGNDTGESTWQQYAGTVNVINGMEAEMASLSDSHLRERTQLLKQRAQQGESLDSLLPVSTANLSFCRICTLSASVCCHRLFFYGL